MRAAVWFRVWKTLIKLDGKTYKIDLPSVSLKASLKYHWTKKKKRNSLFSVSSFHFFFLFPFRFPFLFSFPISFLFFFTKSEKAAFYVKRSISFFLPDLNQDEKKIVWVSFCNIGEYNIDGGWTDDRRRSRVKPFLQWTPPAENWVSWGLFPFLNHLPWGKNEIQRHVIL